MVQAVSNLVGNAIAHGEDPIVVEALDHGDSVEIDVRNRGEIPRSALPGLFDPFNHPGGERREGERREEARSSPGHERRRGHLGLGLYIVRAIAEAHGGSVAAESRDGQAIFRIVLPRDATGKDSPLKHGA
jgi:signal transduction histidine kinase